MDELRVFLQVAGEVALLAYLHGLLTLLELLVGKLEVDGVFRDVDLNLISISQI